MSAGIKEQRIYGLTMALGLGIVASLLLWKRVGIWLYLDGIAVVFLLIALLCPTILRPIHWIWMKVGHVMGIVMTHILLTLTFFIIITPVGLIMRLFGKDPLQRKFDKKAQSYWIAQDQNSPAHRPDKPY